MTLQFVPFNEHPEYAGEKMQAYLRDHHIDDLIKIAKISPDQANGGQVAKAANIDPAKELNCLVLTGKGHGVVKYAAVLVPFQKKINTGSVLKHAMEVHRESFADLKWVTQVTDMEYGSIGPVGLPEDWKLLIDSSIKDLDEVIFGSGRVDSKMLAPVSVFDKIPNVQYVDGLAK